MVFIKHSRWLETRYMHLMDGSVRVKRGQLVHTGQTIALVGSSGIKVSAPHLHFEVLVEGSYVDPLKILEGGTMSYIAAFFVGALLAAGGLYIYSKAGA